jgi:cardiolipin synthase
MRKVFFYLVNFLTYYRLFAWPVLLWLIFDHQLLLFKWLLVFSFFTDAVDGSLARNYQLTSKRGAMLDSIADDLTVLVAIIGMLLYKPGFIMGHMLLISYLLFLYLLQITFALFRYGKISSFHTYLAKTAAILQGIFIISFFFLPEPVDFLFYVAVYVTMTQITEEIILVALLPESVSNVKGLYWVTKKKPTDNTADKQT